ncbi:MAG: DUF1553 domain-containing protein [Verrucomicrobiales bacterium]|nr:DUF1553 domain-containing protein [Verrucomicrobiales bacterium]
MRASLPLLLVFRLAVTASGAVDYEKDIKPLLKERCYACHGALKQKADLRLDTVATMRSGGDSGDILSGDPALLLERVTTTDQDDRMPPEGEGSMLTAEQIAKLRGWLAAGAPAPAKESPEADPRQHWAYQRPQSSGQSVDALLASRLAESHLQPQPEAAPELWLRRVHVDLTGLPPTPDQITAFLKDTSTTARERVVDALLASPHYGERWARHFMDLWRYCDWYGLGGQLRYSQKHLWHWRDWIVESLNTGKGYDDMIFQMLAADELDPNDRDNLRATGYLARSYYLFNRTTWLDATIEHTCRAFLGVTMQCVKCHDHKYDPIDHAAYYQMRAIFEPLHVRLDPWPGEPDLEKNGLPRVFDLHLDRPTYRHIRGDEKNEDQSKPLAAGVPGVLEFASFEPHPVKLPRAAAEPMLLPFVLHDQLAAAERDIAEANKALQQARDALAKTPEPVEVAKTIRKAVIDDDLTQLNPQRWSIINGRWTHSTTGVRQHDTGAERRALRLQTVPPADFEARLSFTIHGGEKWKSVGLMFDENSGDYVMVYLSAVSGGSKIQVSLGRNGKSSYPAAGAVRRTVKEGIRYTLDLRLRGDLLNADIDGEPVLAYRFTEPRRTGAMSLTAFDADVEFHHFRLAELPADAVLREPSAASGPSLADAKAALSLAEKRLAAAQAKPAMLRAVFAAEQRPEDKKLATTAAKADARYQLAKAGFDLARLESDPKAKDAAKKIQAAKEALQKARDLAAQPGSSHTLPLVSRKAQEGPDDATSAQVQTFPATSTGRRLALARWMADARNPLTARVLVNHVWLRHFGTPLVTNVDDFGRRSPAPLHQDVLDTLAVDFMEHDWSLKHLHRRLVLSDLYRRSSSNVAANPATLKADPDNTFYWRMNPRRLESQAVRDSLLHLSGRLDPALGGPSIDPKASDTTLRRSLYFIQNPDTEDRFLGAFDNANVLECYRRNESIVPQQALALTNSKLSRDCADAMARQLAPLDDPAFIQQAFLTLLSRAPTRAEETTCAQGFAALKQNRSLFLQALINHNDFVTLR